MQYMKAHGNTPGPTQRPLLNGALCGLAAGIPSCVILYFTGAFASIIAVIGLPLMIALHITLTTVAGMVYAHIFKRAANDRTGGWLFGACSGFLFWVAGPISIWQIATGNAVATGLAAKGIFAGSILYGLLLGILFPRVHVLIQHRLIDALKEPPPHQKVSKEPESSRG